MTVFVNAVPDSLGFSESYSPREIVTQRKFDFERDYKVKFGAYIQASDDVIVTHTMKLRTHGCITLGTSRNWQGSTMCFELDNGNVVTRRVIEVLPMPDHIIERVNKWGKMTRGKEYSVCVEMFNCKNQLFDWDNEELGETLPEVEEPICIR